MHFYSRDITPGGYRQGCVCQKVASDKAHKNVHLGEAKLCVRTDRPTKCSFEEVFWGKLKFCVGLLNHHYNT